MALLASIAFWPLGEICVNILNGSFVNILNECRYALKIGDIASWAEVKSFDHADCYFLGNLCVLDSKGNEPLWQACKWVPLVPIKMSIDLILRQICEVWLRMGYSVPNRL